MMVEIAIMLLDAPGSVQLSGYCSGIVFLLNSQFRCSGSIGASNKQQNDRFRGQKRLLAPI
jgi:hypothetical protein